VNSPSPAVNPAAVPEFPQSPRNASLRALGLHTPSSLDSVCAADDKEGYVLEGLISYGSINIAVGDSGLGKSALFYQLGICVAAGIPWLGLKTTQGLVIYIDLENGEQNSQNIRDSLVRHLKLSECPDNFLTYFENPKSLENLVREASPSLVIVDSLRAHKPDAEKDNTSGGNFMNSCREIARKYQTAFVFVHHPKKPDEKNGVPPLDETSVMQWLNQACGARALINQSDFRLGIDISHSNFLKTVAEEAALILRGHRRVSGEFGPIYLAREFDDDGEPIGYRRLSGLSLLNEDQQQAFSKLPLVFRFKEAKPIYGRGSQATTDFLGKCTRSGLLRKTPRGYEKVSQALGESVVG
jgi:hypothetical protein